MATKQVGNCAQDLVHLVRDSELIASQQGQQKAWQLLLELLKGLKIPTISDQEKRRRFEQIILSNYYFAWRFGLRTGIVWSILMLIGYVLLKPLFPDGGPNEQFTDAIWSGAAIFFTVDIFFAVWARVSISVYRHILRMDLHVLAKHFVLKSTSCPLNAYDNWDEVPNQLIVLAEKIRKASNIPDIVVIEASLASQRPWRSLKEILDSIWGSDHPCTETTTSTKVLLGYVSIPEIDKNQLVWIGRPEQTKPKQKRRKTVVQFGTN